MPPVFPPTCTPANHPESLFKYISPPSPRSSRPIPPCLPLCSFLVSVPSLIIAVFITFCTLFGDISFVPSCLHVCLHVCLSQVPKTLNLSHLCMSQCLLFPLYLISLSDPSLLFLSFVFSLSFISFTPSWPHQVPSSRQRRAAG